ncbi:MAG: aminotransferase class I/II-fold pyridoxal phosphate-dependent enzyme [Eubacterium sp.]|nr:aminotransferase class I/II-fold pyridoxal phosphate-dependent enzyme [Eubacterium sp.]
MDTRDTAGLIMERDQKRTPLIEAIRRFQDADPAYFCIPAHKMGRGADEEGLRLLGEAAYKADLTEAEGLDDLHDARGAIREAQELSAALWHSEECFFLINGSSSGNEAMILSCTGPGEKILIARNAHVSVMSGLILSGAVPVWMKPSRLPGEAIDGPVLPEEIEKALAENPECRAVFLTSPTYYGICSRIREISAVCHRRGIPLLVDEAHGSHLAFSEQIYDSLSGGADLVVQSLHKTGGSMTQSSQLHRQGGLVDRKRLRDAVRFVSSTSPSYVLMSSLDAARHQLALYGRERVAEAAALADGCRRQLSEIDGIDLVDPECMDPLRVVFSAVRCGLSGTEFRRLLFQEGKISLEMADARYVVAVFSWGNTEEDVNRLTKTVRSVLHTYSIKVPASEGIFAETFISENVYPKNTISEKPSAAEAKSEEIISDGELRSSCPAYVCSPREAWYSESESVRVSDAAGRVAAESVTPYPPGVALLLPGERISSKEIKQISEMKQNGIPLHGLQDPTAACIRVLKRKF